MEYLDFELPIKDIVEQLDKCKIIGNESEIDVTDTCDQLEKKLIETQKRDIREPDCMATCTNVASSF